MNFTVGWDSDAEHALHVEWAASSDPAAVRAAAQTAEYLLALDPSGNGRHLSEGLWKIRVPPLVIHYTIDMSSRHVQVTDVAHTA